MTRLKLLAIIAAAAIAVVAVERVRAAIDAPRLSWIATARQLGPVSYRDPAGGISPDGKWIAYSEGRFLRVRPVGGGAGVDFEPGGGQIRTLVWKPDSSAVVADGNATAATWTAYDLAAHARQRLPSTDQTRGIRQIAWSSDGSRLIGVADGASGNEIRIAHGDSVTSSRITGRVAFPAFAPDGRIACVSTENGRSRLTLPCGQAPLPSHPGADAYGPIAFSPDGKLAYVSLANARGTVDLWSVPLGSGEPRQLTSFDRDSYAPTVANDGSVVFKVQSYRTHVARSPAIGGRTEDLATFQSETPSWDPTGRLLGITYGTWRRVPDDAKYPDISQDAGVIEIGPRPASAPSDVVHDSNSEDQSLCWSPNGRWIAFHSHQDMSDDIWLRASNGSASTTASRITMFGRGAEAGWPRWSRDGKWLLFTAASRTTRRPALYVLGINQDTGEVTAPAQEVALSGLTADVFHGEWIGSSTSIIAIGKEAPGRHAIFSAARSGGPVTVVHRFASEHDFPGLAASPDGQQVAFIAPASDGFFQVFRMPIAGGTPSQVTTDPSNKTQPAWSPDRQWIAFTVWNYEAQFWRMQ